MHAGRSRRERHIDPIIDDERHAERRQRGLERAGLLDHASGVVHLVAQLHQRRPTRRHRTDEVNKIVAAGIFRIDDGVKAQVELLHRVRRCSACIHAMFAHKDVGDRRNSKRFRNIRVRALRAIGDSLSLIRGFNAGLQPVVPARGFTWVLARIL
jgi:hypothetical protein